VENKCPLPHLKVPAICRYSDQDQSGPCPPNNFLNIHLNIILLSKPGSSKYFHSFTVPYQSNVYTSPLPHTYYCPTKTTTFFDMVKFTIVTTVSLLSWCRLSFQFVDLELFLLPTFALKSPNIILKWYVGKWSTSCFNFSQTVFWCITFLFTWCMHII